MRILIKYPTRGRPKKSAETLKKYIDMASDMDNIKIIVSIDEDDKTTNANMFTCLSPNIQVFVGESLGKVHAINRDIPDPKTFDILLLASDDMIPIVKNYDTIIRSKMQEHFPDTDGVLFFNDGYLGYNLNTLVICGSHYYSRFGYIYNPQYKSVFCDNEFMEEANRLGRQVYFDEVLIRHEHPANNSSVSTDRLYNENDKFWDLDKKLYNSRKFKNYDVSVLICTIPKRKNMFIGLINYINKLKQKSSLNIQVLHNDDLNISIGAKRNKLINECLGRYCCFVDDDDKITEDYFKVIEESELKYDCIALNGMFFCNGTFDKYFYHSIKYHRWFEDNYGYYRCPNHINVIKTEIVRQIGFPEKRHGEDFDFSVKLSDSKLIKTEFSHDKIQYLYLFLQKKDSSSTPIVNPVQKKNSIIRGLNLKYF